MKCTVCNVDFSGDIEGGEHIPFEHEVLGVAICALCHERYEGTDFTVGEDNSEDQCAWCGDAGNLVCCDFCPRSFCSAHVATHCGPAVLESDDKWKCFACDDSLLAGLRDQLARSGTTEFMKAQRCLNKNKSRNCKE